MRGLAVTVLRVASHRLPCFLSGVACSALCSSCASCLLSCYSLRSLLRLHLFLVCVSSWSVSRRCWSTSLPDLYIFLACIFVIATSFRPGLYISPVCISSLLVCISSWSVYLSGLYLVIATSSRPDLYKYISLSVSRRCIFVSSSVRWICVSDLLVYLEFRVSSGYSVSRMSCLLRCPCLPRISCPLVSFLSTSNLCAPVKIRASHENREMHKHTNTWSCSWPKSLSSSCVCVFVCSCGRVRVRRSCRPRMWITWSSCRVSCGLVDVLSPARCALRW